MGILSRALEGRATKITGGNLSNPPTWMREFFGSLGGTASGIAVDEKMALRFIAVFACATLLADVMSSLPLFVYRRLTPRGKERATEHPLYRLLHDQPNPEIASFQWRHTKQLHLGLWGNCYSEIEFNGAGRPMALWPLTPWRVTPERGETRGELVYRVKLPDGGEAKLAAPQVLHIPWVSLNGLVGLSPIGLAREAVGLGLAAEEFGSRFFGNDARPGAVLTHPGSLSDPAYQRLKEEYSAAHKGLKQSHRMAILEEGMDIKAIGIPPEDAQFLETRQFQTAEIARFYRVPPHMIGDVERATSWGTGIEAQSIGFAMYTIVPWASRWEQTLALKLLPGRERAEFFIKFLLEGLLRGDFKTRHEGYALGRQWGWYSANDVNEMEDRNPIPQGGDEYLVPLNMVPAAGARSAQAVERRSAEGRRRLAVAFRRMFEDAAARIVRREQADIMRAAKKMLAARGMTDFEAFVAEFYGEHEEFVRQATAPAFRTYAEAVQAEAAAEVGAEAGMTPAMETFTASYIAAFVARWVGSSRGQIVSVAGEALRDGSDPLEALRTRFEEWAERRPEKTGDWETARAGNAVTLKTYQDAGIQRKIWMASANPCPYCAGLNGATVEITRQFLAAGESFQPEGADAAFVTDTTMGHPPLHKGCQCVVAPA